MRVLLMVIVWLIGAEAICVLFAASSDDTLTVIGAGLVAVGIAAAIGALIACREILKVSA